MQWVPEWPDGGGVRVWWGGVGEGVETGALCGGKFFSPSGRILQRGEALYFVLWKSAIISGWINGHNF